MKIVEELKSKLVQVAKTKQEKFILKDIVNPKDTYVLIVGESVRVDNMSLYGYTRSTTPQVEAQRKQIKLFNQAISGAPYTALSVPLSLTADSVLSHDIHNYPAQFQLFQR